MILVHWSCQISDLSHIETEIAICKIGFMMLCDHAHPYIQSTTVVCDMCTEHYTLIFLPQRSHRHIEVVHFALLLYRTAIK